MRPNPHQTEPRETSGRVIYLGDVRRRRAGRKRSPDRHYLLALLLVAAAGWIGWLTVVLTLAPSKLLTYLAFFAPLWVAVAATGAIVAYGVDWRRGFAPGLATCGRRGALVACVVCLNLATLAAHRWSIALAAISILMAAAADVATSRLEI